MRTSHLAAAIVVALTCALSASCLQASPEADASTSTAAASPERVSEPGFAEPIGEATQPMGHMPLWYESKDFPFVVEINDDGKDPAGGWQRSVASLGFVVTHGMTVVYRWKCPIEIGMPVRSEGQGPISSSRASLWTTQAANLVAPLLMDSRDGEAWIGQGEAYSQELKVRLERLLNSQHEKLGAKVKRP
jgi:hypothetical protein